MVVVLDMLQTAGNYTICHPAGFVPLAAPIQYVGINHCGFYTFMARQFLYRSYFASTFQQVGYKGVAKRVTCHMFGDIAGFNRRPNVSLNGCGGNMVAVDKSTAGRMKQVLPFKFTGSLRVLPGQCFRQQCMAVSAFQIFIMQLPDFLNLLLQPVFERHGYNGDSIFLPLPRTNLYLIVTEVKIHDPELQCL